MAAKTWTGATSNNWNDPTNWSPNGVPGSGDTITIPSGTANSPTILNGASATIYAGTVANAGTLNVDSTYNGTNLYINGAVTLSGGGNVVLSDNNNNYIIGSASGSTLTNFNNTIEGGGTIFQNAGLAIINQASGNIEATYGDVALTISSITSFTNAGFLEGVGAAGLTIASSTIANAGGTIEALAGSNVTLNGSSDVEGGALTTAGTGVIQAESATLDGTSSAVTITTGSAVRIVNGQSLTVKGTITDNGTLSIDSTYNSTDLFVDGAVTLNGGGVVALSDNSNNYIYGGVASSSLDNVDDTISGAGTIAADNGLSVVNAASGVIDATYDDVALNISSIANFINLGLIEGTGGAGLTINGSTIANAGGTIEALTGSNVDLTGSADVEGGTLTSVGTGIILINGATLDGTSSAVTISSGSTVRVVNPQSLTLKGTIADTGTLSVDSTHNGTYLFIDGAVTLNGGGVVALSDNVNNLIYGGVAGSSLDVVDDTISGAGTMAPDQGLSVVNGADGTIEATYNDIALTISGIASFTNSGMLEGVGTAGLTITGSTIANAGGTIEALTGSNVDLTGSADIEGGALTSFGTGVILSSTATLDGTASTVTISSGSTVQLDNAQSLTLKGTIANAGTLSVDSTGNGTYLYVSGAATLEGAGGVVLSNVNNNLIYGLVAGSTLDNQQTISGAGLIYVDNGLAFTNDTTGKIDADDTGQLEIAGFGAAGDTFANDGVMQSTNTSSGNGGLYIYSATINQTGDSNRGVIEAIGANANVDLSYAHIVGGTIATSGGGLVFTGGAGSQLDGTTAGDPLTIAKGATVQVSNAQTLYLTASSGDDGVIDNLGTLSVDATSNGTYLYVGTASGGTVTLQGGGNLTLSSSAYNNITGGASNSTLDNVDDIISGAGSIYGLTLINGGTIEAIGGAGLAIADDTTNTGTFEAQSGSTLAINPLRLTNFGFVRGELAGGDYVADDGIISLGGDFVETLGNNSLTTTMVLNGPDAVIGGIESATNPNYSTGFETSGEAGGELEQITADATLVLENFIFFELTTTLSSTEDNFYNAGTLQLGSSNGAAPGATFEASIDYIATASNPFQPPLFGSLENAGLVEGYGLVEGADKVGNIVNDGVISADVSGTTLTLVGNISGTGSLDIGARATLVINPGLEIIDSGGALETADGTADVASTQTLSFLGVAGSLVLGDPVDFDGVVNGLAEGDIIDVDVSYASYGGDAEVPAINGYTTVAGSDGTTILNLTYNGTIAYSITLQGDYVGDSFTILPDVLRSSTYATYYLIGMTGSATWDTTSGSWETASNWLIDDPNIGVDGPGVPGIGSVVSLVNNVNSNAFTVTMTASDEIWSLSAAANSTLNISGASTTLTIDHGGTLSGSVTGTGSLALAGDSTTVSSGATISVAKWSIGAGAPGALAAIEGALNYSGAFALSGSGSLDLVGGPFDITGGTASLAGTIEGSNVLETKAATSDAGLTLDSSVTWENLGVVTQIGGNVTIAAAPVGSTTVLENATGATYDITDNSGIDDSLSADSISNAGLFEKTGGTGVSFIEAAFADTGTVKIATGYLSLLGGGSISGAIEGIGGLELEGGATTFDSGATVSTSSWTTGYQGTSVTIAENLSFAGVFSSDAILTIDGGDTLTLSGTTSALDSTVTGAGTLSLAGGSTTINGGAALTVSDWSLAKPAEATLSESLTYGGALTQGTGSTIAISAGDALTLAGTSSLAGTVTGATLAIAGGTATIASGAVLSASNWSISGSTTDVTLNEGITYSGNFTQSGGTLTLTAGTVLSGSTTFTGGTVNGSHILYQEAPAAVSGLTIGGTVEWSDSSTITEAGGAVTIGDSTSAAASLVVGTTGTYDIADDSGIVRGTSASSSILNQGVFEKTSTSGTSTILVSFSDYGTVSDAGGDLVFNGPVNSFAGTFIGPGMIDYGANAVSTLGNINVIDGSCGTNFGVVQVNGLVTIANGTSITNDSGAHWNFITNVGLALAAGSTSPIFDNYGTLAKTAGTASSVVAIDVSNFSSGTVTASTGTLAFDGPSNSFAGTINGASTVAFTGGTTSIASGTKITVANLSISGASTAVTLNEALTYTGAYNQTGGTLTLTSGTALAAAASLTGGTVNGSHVFYTQATSTVRNFTIGGTVGWDITSTVTESGGSVIIGDSSGSVAFIYVASTGTYDIADNNGIFHGTSTASYFENLGTFAKTGGTGTSVVGSSFFDTGSVSVASGTLAFTGPSNSFAGAVTGAGAVLFGGGIASIDTGTSFGVTNLSESNSGTVLDLNENLAYSGGFTKGVSTTLTIGSGDALTLTGTSNLAGTVNGAGTLALAGGTTTIAGGTALTISHWSISGTGTPATTVTLNEGYNYAGAFSEGANSTLTLTGGTILGAATFGGGTVNGSHILATEAATNVSGLTIGGTVEWENTKTVTQSGGNVSIGDSSGATASLYNAASGIYDIADNSGIGLGTSTASNIVNYGTLEKTGGTASAIAPNIANFGTVSVTSGTLDLQGVLSGTGKDDVGSGATLEADSTVGAGQTFVYTANQSGEFALDDLDVGGKSLFGGTISGFAAGDSLEVGGFGTGTTFLYKSTANNSGYLQLSDNGMTARVEFAGANYNAGNFTPNIGTGSTLFTYNPA